ncbi:amino acid ABC transporter membrane protein 2 (PAAT family) [Rhodopseudomonas thermotolerans]|uniref:Amino acid ABC transporter membrane protein 2 (PAAT family) n=2 Tax=Rhodopseudomonas TaxID=1073 RepID=A0A336JX05_9BRAD|nr:MULTISPECIES: amino acid ABC transporter permease [Rhodopseudomonas]RED27615.1 amino acid ABC transporter membrane protein 2 (PAAT family) [Rhodopseudomonas pentothenatexigens]REF91153.1 amino acid ABC transporter membrane protein 2 (PAAT family) [Rhodopseudomonas thermotolerans]SSW92886.1 amino acid ABC transporter membrane protein 2 (PAAT family) [Rhodopseudomonas pentothenatexigens]
MSELGSVTPVFVRGEMVPQRPPPVDRPGVLGLMRQRLFNSPTNILLTIVGVLLLYFTIVPTVKFLLVDAVWTGSNRTDCLADQAGHPVGACWPFVQAKFSQFIYGFYPTPERWRVDLVFALGALLLLPLLIPRAPAKTLNAGLFFIAFPVLAFFLLYGGGLQGFGVTWSADLASSLADSVGSAGRKLAAGGAIGRTIGPVLLGLGTVLVWLSWPLVALRDWIQASSQPLWLDLLCTAVAVTALVFVLTGVRNGWRALATTVATFVGIAIVIAVLRLDRGGLPIVDTRMWGGLLVTLVVSVTGIVASMPIGIALALGRRSTIPLIRIFSVAFIEFWRGVPLITVMFFATYMLPLFLPGNFTIDNLMRVLIGIALFAGAYNAEVVRGGLNAIPRGQAEAASALGLSYWKTTGLIVLPQALRHVIPGLVNSFIALFKDTSLVSIVALFDLLGQLRAAFADPTWSTPTTLFTGFAFTGLIYFVFCFGMSRYSLSVEHRLNAHRRT